MRGFKFRRVNIFIFLLCTIVSCTAFAGTSSVCTGYKLESKELIRFNSNEKKLICGDSDAVSWKDIPKFQAEYFISTFLQQRGYYFPEFRNEDDGSITIVPGKKIKITQIEVVGAPDSFKIWKRRQIKGRVLTPATLDIIEGWARTELKGESYACPVVSATADAESGVVTLNISSGEKMRIISVEEEPVKGLKTGILRRYDAFTIGGPYKAMNTSLTSQRIVSDGILQTSYFLTECDPEGVKLAQKNVAGARNLLSLAVGASTEEYIIGKAAWKMGRIGENGSSLQVAGRASYRRQRLYIDGNYYPVSEHPRFYLWPNFTTNRSYEKQYEYIATDMAIAPAYKGDTDAFQYTIGIGPKLDYTDTFKGAQKGWTHFLSVAAGFKLMTHDFEYYAADPRSGYNFDVYAEFNSDKIYSSITAQTFRSHWHALWNIGGLEPPIFVIGARGMAGSTLTDYDSPKFPDLPPFFLFYLGGTANLRGFSRMELMSGNHGSLTALYNGIEMRLANVLPLNVQPFLFADFGAVGARSFDIDRPIFWSPGFGLRWPSLVGVLRFTAGHGFLIANNNPANNGLKHWQFIFSIGEEF